MEKDFNSWNEEKKQTDKKEEPIIFYEREVWWCITGVNVGVEIDGKHELFLRPAVVIRKFNKNMALVVPTTNQDKNNKYYFLVSGEDEKSYNTCLSQIRSISSKRLFRKIGTVNEKDYNLLSDKVSNMVKGVL
ncbi:MAG: type II toxin-antitoxin system PemK/MazF family toxin [Candidatus Paceibacterota bacterium]|jgi:mRNA interferase MazF